MVAQITVPVNILYSTNWANNTSKCSINWGINHKGHCASEINQEESL